MGEAVTLGKVEIASTQSMQVMHETTVSESIATIEKRVSKESFYETLETDEMKIQKEVHYSKEETIEERIETTDIAGLLNEPEILETLGHINIENFGPGIETIKELVIIGYLIQKGSSIEDIKQIYNTNGFTALKQPESQFALVQLVEREGHGKLITEILIAEHVADDALLASTVGFLAFLKMIELNHTSVENVISQLSRDDFIRQDWKSIEGKEVLLS